VGSAVQLQSDGFTAGKSLNMSTASLSQPNPTEMHFKARDLVFNCNLMASRQGKA
jgi:hypothetical protein